MNDDVQEVVNETTENVDTQPTEDNVVEGIELTDTPKEEKQEVRKTLRELLHEDETYQEEFNDIVQKRLERKEREYQRKLSKYEDTDNVLRHTLNLQDGDDTNEKLREFYEADGVKLPDRIATSYSDKDQQKLGRSDAEEFIEDGYEAMEEEANRLAAIGYQNLNSREKVTFEVLAKKLTEENNKKELLKLGAKEDLLDDDEFISFKKQFNTDVPMETIYSLYTNIHGNKPKVENPGSMKNDNRSTVKTFYTMDEISKLSEEDLQNPQIYKAVRDSMTKGYNSGF